MNASSSASFESYDTDLAAAAAPYVAALEQGNMQVTTVDTPLEGGNDGVDLALEEQSVEVVAPPFGDVHGEKAVLNVKDGS